MATSVRGDLVQRSPRMTRKQWLAVALTSLLIVGSSAYSHTMDGVDYSGWERPDVGGSCCNNMDCHTATARYRDDHWEVFIEAQWVVVPDAKIIKNLPENPTQAHICHSGHTIYCFAVGGGM